MKKSMIVILLLLATSAFAQSGRTPGMRGAGNLAMMSGVTVGSDGTAYVVRRAASGTNPYEVAAIRPSGAVAWTYALPYAGTATVAANNTTVFVTLFGTTGTFPNVSVKSSLIGLSVASGAPFTVSLDGIAMDVETFTDGVYVVEVATNTGGMMSGVGRKLLSVSNSGKVNFTLPLD